MATNRPTRSSKGWDVDWIDEGPSSTPNPTLSTDAPPSSERVAVCPIMSVAVDEIAFAALRERQTEELLCDLCREPLATDEAGSGLLMWSRGDELRFEEPPLCRSCAGAIGVSAWVRWSQGEDEYD